MPFKIITRAILKGEEQVQTAEIPGDRLRIGRGTACELHLEDLSVSYTHAVIERIEGSAGLVEYVIKDLSGLGTTYVNQVPTQNMRVGQGDVIRIGPYSLRLSLDSPSGPLTVLVEHPADRKANAKTEKVALLPTYQLSVGTWTKMRLMIVVSLLVLMGVSLPVVLGHQRLFMPGEVSLKHQLFADNCASCHSPWKPVWAIVPNKMCKSCHDGPTHFGDRSLVPDPQCASCHVEHKGRTYLAATPDSACVQCHGDLKTKGAHVPVAVGINRFTYNHPEFAVSVSVAGAKTPKRVRLDDAAQLADRSAIRLNHKLHLDRELLGPNGREPLNCTSCHRSDSTGAYMLPVNYKRDCERCHLLDFDGRLPGKVVPHGRRPEEIHEFLRAVYAEYYFSTHREELRARGPIKRLPGERKSEEESWVDDMRERAEQYLFSKKTKKCLFCHLVQPPKSDASRIATPNDEPPLPLPVVVKPAIPERWLPYSVFDHAPHTDLIKEKGCTSCHQAAGTSEKTKDVLLPRIDSCRYCHFDPGGAQTQCVACHLYHDKSKPRQSEHPFKLEEFKQESGPPPTTESRRPSTE